MQSQHFFNKRPLTKDENRLLKELFSNSIITKDNYETANKHLIQQKEIVKSASIRTLLNKNQTSSILNPPFYRS